MTMPFDRNHRVRQAIAAADRARDARHWEAAAGYYRAALERNPGNPPIWVQYGHALKESGGRQEPRKLSQAEAAYRRALAYDPRVADTHLQLGHVLKLQGRIEEAQVAYLHAFALDPMLPSLLLELSGLGWSEAALAELRRAAVASPDAIAPTGSGDEVEPATSPASVAERSRDGIEALGLFDPEAYLALNEDVRASGDDAWGHFARYGLGEGRHFTSPESVARALARADAEIKQASRVFRASAERALASGGDVDIDAAFRRRGLRVGVYCSSEGNFYMKEIADLLMWGLRSCGIDAVERDEAARQDEPFDLRVFVAPHEYFTLGRGPSWVPVAAEPRSVLYNVEQFQTKWFCLALPLLLRAPLVLDISFQSAELLRRLGCNAVHFMPGYLPEAPSVQPCIDVSDIELVRGYSFAYQAYNWLERNVLADRPIDILFIGGDSPRRDETLARLRHLSDKHRFVCVYRQPRAPLTRQDHRETSTAINNALAQRSKIVLNIHRDWLGYFEYTRIVAHGFWQGACIVSDPGLPHPIFDPGVHYLEESTRHLGELLEWLLDTDDGRRKLDATRMAAYEQARGLGSMRIALIPVLAALRQLLDL